MGSCFWLLVILMVFGSIIGLDYWYKNRNSIEPPPPYYFSPDPDEEMMAQVLTMEMMDDEFNDPLM
jgi:hypothetical protein